MRDVDEQRAGGGASHRGVSPVPEDALGGHAFHTYSLVSGDGLVEFQFRHNVQGRSVYAEGTVDVRGRVIEIDPPTRMVWSWAFGTEADNPEKLSRVTYELTALGPDTRLTVRHAELEPGSMMDEGVRNGWPAVLSNLKSILETGEVLREDQWPKPEQFEHPET